MDPKDRIEVLDLVIAQHTKSLETIERIRWQALGFLGTIGSLAVYVQIRGMREVVTTGSDANGVLGVFAVVVALTGSLVQARIAAIAVSLLARIRVLQLQQADVLRSADVVCKQAYEAAISPDTRGMGLGMKLLLPTVSNAFFILFAAVAGIGAGLAVRGRVVGEFQIDLPTGLLTGVVLLGVSMCASARYRAHVDRELISLPRR